MSPVAPARRKERGGIVRIATASHRTTRARDRARQVPEVVSVLDLGAVPVGIARRPVEAIPRPGRGTGECHTPGWGQSLGIRISPDRASGFGPGEVMRAVATAGLVICLVIVAVTFVGGPLLIPELALLPLAGVIFVVWASVLSWIVARRSEASGI